LCKACAQDYSSRDDDVIGVSSLYQASEHCISSHRESPPARHVSVCIT